MMLTTDEAEKRLAQFEVKNFRERRMDAVNALPGRLKSLAMDIFNVHLNMENIDDWDVIEKKRRDAVKTLQNIGSDKRIRIFKALFPEISHHVEALWQKTYVMTYQMSMTRRSFRAPEAPDITLPGRQQLIDDMLHITNGYEQDITWYAAWAPYLPAMGSGFILAPLLAAAIDTGSTEGDRVFDILVQSAKGEHDIGQMGRHVTGALLAASRPDGWQFVEKMLLAAQRQEGLRQVILESVDEAHPEAFKRMLQQVIDNNLTRFSSVVRAVDVWFGFQWESKDHKRLNMQLGKALRYLNDARERKDAIQKGDAPSAYLALWAEAFYNVQDALPEAVAMLHEKDVQRRFAAVYLLVQLDLPDAETALVTPLKDKDLRIAYLAMTPFFYSGYAPDKATVPGLFDALEKNIDRFPEKQTELEPILWPWCRYGISRDQVLSTMLRNLQGHPPSRLIPYIHMMSVSIRTLMAQMLKDNQKKLDKSSRKAFIDLAGDAGSGVRSIAFEALADIRLTSFEAEQIAEYLKRKPGDLRKGVIRLLLNQDDDHALESARFLIRAKDKNQRNAGLEVLTQMHGKGRLPDACQALAAEYRTETPDLTDKENAWLESIIRSETKQYTLENALGLMEPNHKTRPPEPEKKKPNWDFIVAANLITGLDEWIHENRETTVEISDLYNEDRTNRELLGTLGWRFPACNPALSLKDDIQRLPLKDHWQHWWKNRPDQLKDEDGLEAVRAAFLLTPRLFFSKDEPGWLKKLNAAIFGKAVKLKTRYDALLVRLVPWFMRIFPQPGTVDFCLDSLETFLAMIPEDKLQVKSKNEYAHWLDWRFQFETFRRLIFLLDQVKHFQENQWTDEQVTRHWHLLRWIDEPLMGKTPKRRGLISMVSGKKEPLPRFRPQIADVLSAYEKGIASEADLYDMLIGPRYQGASWVSGFNDLQALSRRTPGKLEKKHPFIRALVNNCRQRILQVEKSRGDLPTPASEAALALKYTGNADVFLDFSAALGSEKFTRGYTYDQHSRASVFSHIIRSTYPLNEDLPDAFTKKVKSLKIRETRLIEAAVYAPQWSRFIESTLGWKGFSSAVWWIYAHTKDSRWTVDQEIRDAWSAQVNSYTPLDARDLLNGAVDVDWFESVYNALGDRRWKKLETAVRYASGGAGHTRAKLFANAMLGRLTRDDLIKRINNTRHQDAVRALGLVPLEKGEDRAEDLMNRYRFFQEFIRTGKKFGAQKRNSEKLAMTIGMENLARTAGYKDALRMQWELEAVSVQDLTQSMPSVTVDQVTVSLSIQPSGIPDIHVEKNGKPLKSIPAKIKKNENVKSLVQRKTDLKRQLSLMKASLENAMCRRDQFTCHDIRSFYKHPLLKPMTDKILFVIHDGVGLISDEGAALESYPQGKIEVRDSDTLTIAHPFDLLESGQWHRWHERCFKEKIVQPFKQVFRELYVITETEKTESKFSRRYEGHQVQPRKTAALLGSRGWVLHPEEGAVKTFHNEKITARLSFMEGVFTPADVEDLTIETVHFTKPADWQPLKLTDIHPIIFSEVMRDVDLVVSVAHSGGVDPETSASTVRMRAVLVWETCMLLGIENVKIKDRHVLINGSLSDYSVHLGSGVVHRIPGGHLFIVPIHSQHRGRVFLPFADDDPKTAEVISKVILLAEDKKIKDPTVLEQFR